MSENTLNLIKENDVRWIDLRFTDSQGKEQHVSIPATEVDEDFFDGGKMFDGSSIAGWRSTGRGSRVDSEAGPHVALRARRAARGASEWHPHTAWVRCA